MGGYRVDIIKPYYYFDCIANVEGGVLRFMRFFRLFKLMRLRGLGTMIKTLESLSHGAFLIGDVKLLWVFCLCAHWTGSFFFGATPTAGRRWRWRGMTTKRRHT